MSREGIHEFWFRGGVRGGVTNLLTVGDATRLVEGPSGASVGREAKRSHRQVPGASRGQGDKGNQRRRLTSSDVPEARQRKHFGKERMVDCDKCH